MDSNDITIINPYEALAAARSKLNIGYQPNPGNLWLFSFGAVGATHLAYWDDGVQHLEGSLEEVAGWLVDNAPGHIMEHDDPYLKELIEDVLKERGRTWKEFIDDVQSESWAQDVEQEAFADLTYTEAGYLTSYEWTVDELDPHSELFGELFELSINESDLDEEEVEEANEVAENIGLDVEWEIDAQ